MCDNLYVWGLILDFTSYVFLASTLWEFEVATNKLFFLHTILSHSCGIEIILFLISTFSGVYIKLGSSGE